jgi:hypothetical protein
MRNLILIAICFASMAIGCTGDVPKTNADMAQREATKAAMNEAQRQVGMPAIKNFQERKLAKMIFELRDQEDYVCHAYLVNQMTGEVGQYLGKCLGYGLPYSVQFTNPEKLVFGQIELGVDLPGRERSESIRSVPQADPNGLFMPSGLSATWIMLYDEDSEEFRPIYVEPLIIVSPFKLHEDKVTASGQ